MTFLYILGALSKEQKDIARKKLEYCIKMNKVSNMATINNMISEIPILHGVPGKKQKVLSVLKFSLEGKKEVV